MNTPIQPPSGTPAHEMPVRSGKPRTKRARTYVLLLAVWALLVGLGGWGAKAYTDRLQQQLKADISVQTEAQLALIQQQYQAQIAELQAQVGTDMKQLQTKIDAVNELLSFTKDSASSKTDNSNQLYTQLSEVTKKLDELKKQLDALQ
ncbi:hypothetical protein SAMN02799630_02495 [Paenibacillus sp. UNCCL117]|uniref:hypothetical protein n=1 Tax=unclassified Paenibacillus TaxID=185978 RepID=UPI000883A69B|nr:MULTISPECIES: hypothetical protein [unclassified Paenibacillus]SDC03591.1 hypothetical protein SAMN04488602_101164 [Paenibacillus sp. cl123]SFW37112.1 hypothetical protein SAMN02799630_02495 [Paenibacillus sp. UNCCL117]